MVSELMLTKGNELPPKAREYVVKLSKLIGTCGETFVTAFYDYCQLELKMKCNHSYKITNERKAYYK